MRDAFADVLRRTLALIEQNEELWQEAPALADLRRSLTRAIGEIEAQKPTRKQMKPRDLN